MKQLIAAMLDVQRKVNESTIGVDWPQDASTNFTLAIMQECAEGQDHLAWKWWSKQIPDLKAAQMEAIDVMHFVLAQELQKAWDYGRDDSIIANDLMEDWNNRMLTVHLDTRTFLPEGLDAPLLFRLVSGMAAVDKVSFGLTCLLCERLDLSFTDLYRLYNCKAVLNIFRQKNGYKFGQYKKMWAEGVEDNVFLQKIAGVINWKSADAGHTLYHQLEAEYAKVLAR